MSATTPMIAAQSSVVFHDPLVSPAIHVRRDARSVRVAPLADGRSVCMGAFVVGLSVSRMVMGFPFGKYRDRAHRAAWRFASIDNDARSPERSAESIVDVG